MRINAKRKLMAGPGKWLAGLAFFLLIQIAAGRDIGAAGVSFGAVVKKSLSETFAWALYEQFLPMATLGGEDGSAAWFVQSGVDGILPLYGMARREVYAREEAEGGREAGKANEHSVILRFEELMEKMEGEKEQGPREEEDLQALFRAENNAVRELADFTPHEKRLSVDMEELRDYETLVKNFYTIDANTTAGSDQLDAIKLMERDMRIDRGVEGPQILIYHTHSKEAFADSKEGDDMTGIMGVGEHLKEILETRYGYEVLHHMGQYDVEGRDNAYGNALPDLERVLAENPSIQVVIDLHRDQMPEETKLVMNLDGRPTARFMFFNGLSRTRRTGDIAYLKNENIADNLAFSFQMQLMANEYYPGLTRKIYLKGYRYNMHVCPKTLLVELGAQNNTVEEAMNACEPLAHVLDLVIGGGQDTW